MFTIEVHSKKTKDDNLKKDMHDGVVTSLEVLVKVRGNLL